MSPAASLPDFTALRDRFLAAQLKGDRRGALEVALEGVERGGSILEVQDHVLRAAQLEIGRLWQENRVSVAQEHMATAIANLVLSQLFERAPLVPRNGKVIFVACVEGELHEFPARLVADALDLAGYDVRYLGANVPTDSLLGMLRAERPDMVALSATMTFHLPALKTAVERIRAAHGKEITIAIGGGALTWAPSVVHHLEVDVRAATAPELVLAVARSLGIPPPSGTASR